MEDKTKIIEELKRKNHQLERDNKLLNTINATSEKLRNTYEKEKDLQYLYNDLLLVHCPNMIFLLNDQLRLVLKSNPCDELLKYTDMDDLRNLPFKEIFSVRVDTDWIDKVYTDNKKILNSTQSLKYDDTINLSDGEFMHVQITINPIIDDKENCIGTILTINDVTDLIESNMKAEEAAKSKSNFLANMSHEIRTPMNAVKGLSELLSLTELNGLQRNYVDNIINSANSLLSIINDVLDFSKIDANKIELIKGPFNLSEMISSVANMVSMRAENKDLEMIINVDPNLPTVINGDDVRIKQIITNILSNAVKYTAIGSVELRLNLENENGIDWLKCEIEDTGIGIKEDDLQYLFDAFARADHTKNRNIAGTGLGLAISKQLANAMGGEIWVESEYGVGSTFGFKIPTKVIDSTPIAKVNHPEKIKVLTALGVKYSESLILILDALGIAHDEYNDKTTDDVMNKFTHYIIDESIHENLSQKINKDEKIPQAIVKDMRHAMDLNSDFNTVLYLPLYVVDVVSFLNGINEKDKNSKIVSEDDLKVENAKVLVVDDNEINLIVSGEMLATFDTEIKTAINGYDAIEMCKSEKFDLIFMDHMMPGIDGIETTKRIRNEEGPNKLTPIIALTANVINDMKSKYIQSGMNDFIGKPIEFSDLNRVLKNWLPKEKIQFDNSVYITGKKSDDESENTMSPDVLVASLDNFGLYTTDVLKEMSGNFDGYIDRMEQANTKLGNIVSKLKNEVQNEAWTDFIKDILDLRNILYGIGARDCAGRARNLAIAARDGNIPYIHGDFFSLMGNMYMLDKKLDAIVSVGRGGSMEENPLNTSQYLHGVMEKLGRAIVKSNAVEAMSELENAASFSLNKDLDMGLKEIKKDLEKGDFNSAQVHHSDAFDLFVQNVIIENKE